MPTISREEAEKIVKDYSNGATYKQLHKKYGRSLTTIRKVLREFQADWFNIDEVTNKHQKKYKRLPENIEQIARDYKDGFSYKKLQEKYGYKQHTLHRFFKEFEKKVDWFDLKAISRFHSTPAGKGKIKYSGHAPAQTNSVYANFLNTLISCGLTKTEAWAVMNFLLKKSDANYYADQLTTNKEVIGQIIKKTQLRSLEFAFKSIIQKENIS